jgi:hypothetical protein
VRSRVQSPECPVFALLREFSRPNLHFGICICNGVFFIADRGNAVGDMNYYLLMHEYSLEFDVIQLQEASRKSGVTL